MLFDGVGRRKEKPQENAAETLFYGYPAWGCGVGEGEESGGELEWGEEEGKGRRWSRATHIILQVVGSSTRAPGVFGLCFVSIWGEKWERRPGCHSDNRTQHPGAGSSLDGDRILGRTLKARKPAAAIAHPG